jgi:hypothetical protein
MLKENGSFDAIENCCFVSIINKVSFNFILFDWIVIEVRYFSEHFMYVKDVIHAQNMLS